MESVRRRLDFCWHACVRLKTKRPNGTRPTTAVTSRRSLHRQSLTSVPAHVTTNNVDLINESLLFALPIGAFVVAGLTAKDSAGPSAIISALLSALAAILSGLSLSEISSRKWRYYQTSAYEFMYRTGSEAAAFLVGWLFILHHCCCSALASRAVSQNIDMVLSKRISNLTITEFGRIPYLDSHLDLIALLFTLVNMVIIAANLQLPAKKMLTISSNSIVLGLIVFAFVVGLYDIQFRFWDNVDKFFPHGASGILGGSATMYCIFSAIFSSVVHNSSEFGRSKLRRRWFFTASSISNVVIFFTVIGVTSFTTLLTSSDWVTEIPFPESYGIGRRAWMKYVICIASVVVLVPHTALQLFRAIDLLTQMASDGLVLRIFRRVPANNSSDTLSAWSYISLGTAVSIIAMLFNLSTLAQIASITIVCIHASVAAIVVTNRYKPEVWKRKSKRKMANQFVRNRYGTNSSGITSIKADEYVDDSQITEYDSIADVNNLAFQLESGLAESSNFDSFVAGDNVTTDPENIKACSSSSSSDTDIDEIVDDFREMARVEAINRRQGDDSLLDVRIPTVGSHNRSVLLLTSFSFSSLVLCFLVFHLSSPTSNAVRIAFVFLIISCSISLLLSAFFLFRLPRNEPEVNLISNSVSLAPSVQLIFIAFAGCLLSAFDRTTTVFLCIWSAIGVLFYFVYGIRHSLEMQNVDNSPAEQRSLIAISSSSSSATTETTVAPASDSFGQLVVSDLIKEQNN